MTPLRETALTGERFGAPELVTEARGEGLRAHGIPATTARRGTGGTEPPTPGYAFGLARISVTTWNR